MKKILKLLLFFVGFLIIFELIITIFKTYHNINYKIKTERIKYDINEIYKEGNYYLKIKNNVNIYSYEVPNSFFKKKKIVKDIYTYTMGDISCIYPVYKKDKVTSNIMCSKNNNSYSYEYYKERLKPFTSLLEKKGYSNISWNEESNKQNKLETLTVYPNNISDNTYIYIYNYKGFYAINNKQSVNIRLLKNDKYKNTLGTIVNKYYLLADYDENHSYKHFYRIDMTKNKIKKFKVKKEISKDSYINGVIDDDVYIFDKDNLVQYKINPNKKKQKEVGNKENKVLNYDLGFKRINVYKMRDEEIRFKTIDNYIDKLEKNTNIKYIEKDKDSYYYQTDNDDVYYYNTNSKIKVLLFNKKISDFKLVNNNLFFISDDTLYSYSIDKDINKLIKYSELSFNPDNRIAIYIE